MRERDTASQIRCHTSRLTSRRSQPPLPLRLQSTPRVGGGSAFYVRPHSHHHIMPVTLSYDVTNLDNNERNYIRSMLERFHWQRLGGSVFRYDGVEQADGSVLEDWLNHVAPALMFLRSYALQHGI